MAESLRCFSVHSVKGGVGKSTVARLVAEAAARQGPTLLVDVDLTGTSLADVMALHAPNVSLADLPAAQPDGYLSVEESRARMEDRAKEDGWRPSGVPFLNDFLLWEPANRHDLALELNPQALIWETDGELRVLPSSALPRDLHAILPVIYDELNAGFLESRLEWLLEQLLQHTAIRTVVFDSPPTIPGLSGALLSMAMRLPEHLHLAPDQPTTSPPLLFDPSTRVSWVPVLLVSPDHQDIRAADRWVSDKPESEIERLLVVANYRDGDIDEGPFLERLRYALMGGPELSADEEPPLSGYDGRLLAPARTFTLRREAKHRAWRPGAAEQEASPPEGFERLWEEIERRWA